MTSVDRRGFLKASAAAALAARLPASLGAAQGAAPARKFKLAYAPHIGMFKEHANQGGLVAELEFMAAEGFTALEDNGLKGRSVADQELIGKTLARLNMRMGVFVSHTIAWNEANLTSGDATARDAFLQQIRESVDVAKRVNGKWMVCVPGHVDRRLDMSYQTANVTESLKRAAAILEPHGLVMVIETLNTQRDTQGSFSRGFRRDTRSAAQWAVRRSNSCSTFTTPRSRKEISFRTSMRRGMKSCTSR